MDAGRACLAAAAGLHLLSRARPGFRRHRRAGPGAATGSGRSGAWLAGFFFFLFGRPAYLFPIMLALCRMAGAQGPVAAGCALANQYAAARRRLRADAADQLRPRDPALGRRGASEQTPAACSANSSATAARAGLSFLGATLLLLGLWLAGRGAVPRRLVVRGHGQARRLGAQGHRVDARANGAAARARLGPAAQAGAPGSGARGAEEGREPSAAAHRGGWPPCREKSERVERERQVPLFDAPKSSELPALSLLDEPRAREQSYSDEALGGDVAPGGAEAARLRRGGRGGGGATGPGHHALRAASRARRQGEPDQQSVQGSGARAVGDQRARGGDHPGQIGGGPGDPEREARDRHAWARSSNPSPTTRSARRSRSRSARTSAACRWSRISHACRTC